MLGQTLMDNKSTNQQEVTTWQEERSARVMTRFHFDPAWFDSDYDSESSDEWQSLTSESPEWYEDVSPQRCVLWVV
jgi:hypothetical protein